LLQQDLNRAMKVSNIYLVKKKYILLFNSFSTRLKAIKTVSLDSSNYLMPGSLYNTDCELISIAFGLTIFLPASVKFGFYVNKVSKQSFYFPFPGFYYKSICSLVDLTLFPILEVLSGKSWQGFRPFRVLSDSVLVAKNVFYKFKLRSYILKLPLRLTSYSLFPKFFVKKFILHKLFNKRSFFYFYKDNNKIIFPILISFLLNEFFNYLNKGFLRKRKVNNFLLPLSFDFFSINNELLFFSSNLNELFVFNLIFNTFCVNSNFGLVVRNKLSFSLFNGFDFMSWRFFMSKSKKLFNIINLQEIRNYKRSLKSLITKFLSFDIFLLIKTLNNFIITWLNNYKLLNYPWDICSELDLYLYKLLWRFVCRRHLRKSNRWIYNKYWKFLSGKWRFFVFDTTTGNILFLNSHVLRSYKIYRLPSFVNFFDLLDNSMYRTYWFYNLNSKLVGIYRALFIAQSGICVVCKKSFNLDFLSCIKLSKLTLSNINSNKVAHLVLIHNYCSM
jgi:RNA-directed DNA polymerase